MSQDRSMHAAHIAHRATELAMNSPQGQAAIAAATATVVAAAPVVVPIAMTAAVGYGLYRGIQKLLD